MQENLESVIMNYTIRFSTGKVIRIMSSTTKNFLVGSCFQIPRLEYCNFGVGIFFALEYFTQNLFAWELLIFYSHRLLIVKITNTRQGLVINVINWGYFLFKI